MPRTPVPGRFKGGMVPLGRYFYGVAVWLKLLWLLTFWEAETQMAKQPVQWTSASTCFPVQLQLRVTKLQSAPIATLSLQLRCNCLKEGSVGRRLCCNYLHSVIGGLQLLCNCRAAARLCSL